MKQIYPLLCLQSSNQRGGIPTKIISMRDLVLCPITTIQRPYTDNHEMDKGVVFIYAVCISESLYCEGRVICII